MYSDLRLALRRLAHARTFAVTAILTLALGIGANTGIFTLIHGVLMQSLPVANPGTILRVGDGDNCCVLGGTQGHFSVYSYGLYQYLRTNTPEFEEMAAFEGGPDAAGVRRTGDAAARPFVPQFVSGNYFRLFGLKPFAGRLIGPDDDRSGSPPVAVISYHAWQQMFAADPSIIGSTFTIDGFAYTIIGVAPQGFFGADIRPNPPDFWMPLSAEPAARGKNSLLAQKNSHWLYVFGREGANFSLPSLQAKLDNELHQWLVANEPANTERERAALAKQSVTLIPGGAGLNGMRDSYRRDLRLLIGITALVLLIACANLANLQLARGAADASQASIRVALGAPRIRLMRLALIECTLLSVVGGALGLLISNQTAHLLIRTAFRGADYVPISVTPSLPVLAFAFGLSVLTGVVFGIAPAWSASKADPANALRRAGRSAAQRSTGSQRILVVFQAALSLVLLATAGLMTQTLRNLTGQEFGLRMDGTLVADVNAAFSGYAPEKIDTLYREVREQAEKIPGVRNAALALYSPMSGNNWQMNVTLEDHPDLKISPSWDRVSGNFFDAIGAHVLRGRTFDDRDTPLSVHVAVINQAFADTYYSHENPVGKRLGLGGLSHRADYEIVGVVNTIRFRDPRGAGRPMLFVPLLQMTPNEWNDTMRARSNLIESVVLRVSGDTSNLSGHLRRIFGGLDPNLTLLRISPMKEQLGRILAHEDLIGTLSRIFAGLALLLASLGLYGLTAYSTARRTSEIGVRTALGATSGDVVRLILKDAMLQAAMGIAVGIPAALAAGQLLASQLYGVKTSDPWILGGAAFVLVFCAALAGLIPARRAGTLDPVQALRIEN